MNRMTCSDVRATDTTRAVIVNIMAEHMPSGIGYGLLSSLISSEADLHAFRSFKALNVRNILYLQSELAEIEETWRELDEEYNDKAKSNDIWSVPRSWRAVRKEDGDYLEAASWLRKISGEYCMY